MKNTYYKNALFFKDKLIEHINEIFEKYQYRITLKMEDANLLNLSDNCIKSSTALGFCIEEFVISKLLEKTKNNNDKEDNIFIQRSNNKGTQNSSYDFFSKFINNLYLVNIKVDKSNNCAVAALNQLYKDYVIDNHNIDKHFFILKIHYSLCKNYININYIDGYFLEEIDFQFGYYSDSRNWSNIYNKKSGRLQVSKSFFDKNKKDINNISYEITKQQIIDMFEGKIKRNKK